MTMSISSNRGFPELDKYELLEEIGHGGMATVYRARDLRLDREVAVKLIHKHLRDNPEVRRRFTSEAKAVAKLRHPAIVEVYDVSAEEDEERYIVVELIRGMSLRQLLQERQLLPPEVAATITARLCDAVEHAHQTGVVHRDIKPENVLLELPEGAPDTARDSEPPTDDAVDTPLSEGVPPPSKRSKPNGDGHRPSSERSIPRRHSDATSGGHGSSARSHARVLIKLTDFGIAKLLDVQGVTSTGQILGSPAHMAPEQIEGGDIGPWTDVFALGVLMYEMMVGHLPFEGKNPAQVLRRVLEGNYEPADAERADVGGRWAGILAAALATKVADRVASAAALAVMIREELDALTIADPEGAMVAYFEDEPAYHERVRTSLVPKLMKRGERERRAGHIPGAAADFNRALALKPDDMAILKRVSSLSAETVWKERALRIGGMALAAGALFGATFAVARWIRQDAAEATLTLPDAPPLDSAPAPSAIDATTTTDDVDTTATRSASSGKVAVVAPPALDGSADPDEPDPTTAAVRFSVIPSGGTLSIDGTPQPWFGKNFDLAVGNHSFVAKVKGPCCEEANGSFYVKAPETEGAVQTITIQVPIKPALFLLKGGPAGSSVSCQGATAVSGGGAAQLKLSGETAWSGSCRFSNDVSMPYTLKAGETTSIQWPG